MLSWILPRFFATMPLETASLISLALCVASITCCTAPWTRCCTTTKICSDSSRMPSASMIAGLFSVMKLAVAEQAAIAVSAKDSTVTATLNFCRSSNDSAGSAGSVRFSAGSASFSASCVASLSAAFSASASAPFSGFLIGKIASFTFSTAASALTTRGSSSPISSFAFASWASALACASSRIFSIFSRCSAICLTYSSE
mmetsp:Transcript_119366/g.315552  ORF Transcript_119366/g.315552 Transcript_119366/m.315552 type:complete len:200 (-) Transcript_119366:779-1378(-)